VHRYSGERYPFITNDLEPLSPGVVRGQLDWLSPNVRRNDPRPHVEALPKAHSVGGRVIYSVQKLDRGPIREGVERTDIRSVVERYVQLNVKCVGHCPWPEHHKDGDRHKSFQVFEKTGRW